MIIGKMADRQRYFEVHSKFREAFEFIKNAVEGGIEVGKYELDGKALFASVQEYTTKAAEECRYEAHRKYIDIQYIVSGAEVMRVCDINSAEINGGFNEGADVGFYKGGDGYVEAVIEAGQYGIFFPEDVHMPCIAYTAPAPVKKIVVKVAVDETI